MTTVLTRLAEVPGPPSAAGDWRRVRRPGRCTRCRTVTFARTNAHGLCGSCEAGDRAVDQAERSEREVRGRLYAARTGSVLRIDSRDAVNPDPATPHRKHDAHFEIAASAA
jgi:hypothetical protein